MEAHRFGSLEIEQEYWTLGKRAVLLLSLEDTLVIVAKD